MTAVPPPPPAAPTTVEAQQGRPLAVPLLAIVGYTLRGCLPAKRWFGVLLPCLGALLFGLLSTALDDDTTTTTTTTVIDEDTTFGRDDVGFEGTAFEDGEVGTVVLGGDLADERNFADVAEIGLFALILPLTCLVVGDAVLGADARAGTFQLTWLSPVPFATIAFGRWLGGWLVTLVTLVPALALAPIIAGVPDAAVPMALAAVLGSGAYLALFMMVGVVTRRSALWSLAIVLLGEWLLGTQLSGVAQVSPLWQAQQLFAGLWEHGELIERDGMPLGWSAAVRLALVGVVCLALATWRLGRMRPISTAD